MIVYIPLREGSKVAAVSGWAKPDYAGVPHRRGDWHALRTDGLVVVDCDTFEAAEAWLARTGLRTMRVSTPRGWHFYYVYTEGSPTGPMVGVYDHTDIRAGSGSYVVAPGAPGYFVSDPHTIIDFNPAWLPEPKKRDTFDAEDTIGEGRRNSTLAAIGGALRRQGLSTHAIARGLAALNAVLVEPPLEIAEVQEIAASVARYEPDPDKDIELVP